MVKHLIRVLDMEVETGVDEKMMPVDFNRISGLPYAIGACHVYGGANLAGILLEPRKQEVWTYFLDLGEAYEADYAALVFNTNGRGRWVIHSNVTMRAVQASAIVHQGGRDPFIAQPFTEFCSFLKE